MTSWVMIGTVLIAQFIVGALTTSLDQNVAENEQMQRLIGGTVAVILTIVLAGVPAWIVARFTKRWWPTVFLILAGTLITLYLVIPH